MKKEATEHKRSKEITGIVLLAVALFLLLCLASYNPLDPSFTHYVGSAAKIKNIGGFIGSYLSDSLLKASGITAYLFPAVFILFSFRLFVDREFNISVATAAGFIGLIVSTSALLAESHETIRFFGVNLKTGGILGAILSEQLSTYLNHGGTYIVLTVIFLISIIVTLDISLLAFTKKLAEFAGNVLSYLKTFIVVRIERLKRRKKSPANKRKSTSREIPIIVDDTEARKANKREEQIPFEFLHAKDEFSLPPLDLLEKVEPKNTKIKKESLIMNARLLEKKLTDFGVEGKVVEVKSGPVITMYELEPAPGVKINRVTNLSDDLALALRAQNIRIVAPIPGKAVIGIEIPNQERESVYLRDAIDNDTFLDSKYKLPIVLGKDIIGDPAVADLVKMPHLLIAGTTGSGKSVSLNTMICSILFRVTPDNVKLLMIDPKRLELSAYEGIPHLLHPVVVNPKKAAQVLMWAVEEMERRYRVMSEAGVKSIERYNKTIEKGPSTNTIKPVSSEETPEGGPANPPEKMPYIVIVIDELADLMMVAQKNVEEALTRLAQMARAAGIHLILATQRPSVDVITGIIKANFPTRISFQVSSKIDSRTILDQLGAEKLLGAGDMLFMPSGTSKLMRIHGAFVSDGEINRIVDFVKKQGDPLYDESIAQYEAQSIEHKKSEEDMDEKYDEAVELVTDLGQASISLVQRYMKIGYNRAARIIERMEAEGVVGPSDGAKPRKVLAGKLPR